MVIKDYDMMENFRNQDFTEKAEHVSCSRASNIYSRIVDSTKWSFHRAICYHENKF